MYVSHQRKNDRTAEIKSEGDFVLYDAFEKERLIYKNMFRPVHLFWSDYTG